MRALRLSTRNSTRRYPQSNARRIIMSLTRAVEAHAAEVRAIVGAADLERLAAVVDAEEAAHADQRVAFEQSERHLGRLSKASKLASKCSGA